MRSARRLARALAVLLAGAALLAGCRSEDGPVWIRLAEGPGPTEAEGAPPHRTYRTREGREFRIERRGEGFWGVVALRRAAWSAHGEGGTWMAAVPCRALGAPAEGSAQRLFVPEGRSFTYDSESWTDGEFRGEPGSFFALGSRVLLRLAPGEEPPAETVLEVFAYHGRRDAEGVQGVAGRRFSGEGLAIPPSWRVVRTLDVPPASRLRFGTCAERTLLAKTEDLPPVTFRVRLEGQVIHEHTQPVEKEGTYARHDVPLPPEGAEDAVLELETSGAPAYASFLAPTIGPAEVGTYDARPWGTGRPSVVVFLADTFRADNLEAYGGAPEIAPELNRFVEESLCFERAWSTSTHTLPSHASLFAGMYPPQTGVVTMSSALPAELETLAERLAAWGYRTGAVTDAVILSRTFGMDQGFAWFDERHGTIESSLARAREFLEADDGRPVFLFLQTYRTHTPYRVSESTRRELEGRGVTLAEDYDALIARGGDALSDPPITPETAPVLTDLETLYRGGARDLDRAFGELRGSLEELGLGEAGYLVFTSDHGEAFGEHGELWHSGEVFEEQVRVPLVLHGPGIEPRRSSLAASGVDLAPTVADLADVPAHDGWLGVSLLRLDRDRPVYAYQGIGPEGFRPTAAIIEGSRKLIVYREGDRLDPEGLRGAFDLVRDPGERHDLGGDEGWPASILRRLGPVSESHLVPRVDPSLRRLDVEQEAVLAAMGYGGLQK